MHSQARGKIEDSPSRNQHRSTTSSSTFSFSQDVVASSALTGTSDLRLVISEHHREDSKAGSPSEAGLSRVSRSPLATAVTSRDDRPVLAAFLAPIKAARAAPSITADVA